MQRTMLGTAGVMALATAAFLADCKPAQAQIGFGVSIGRGYRGGGVYIGGYPYGRGGYGYYGRGYYPYGRGYYSYNRGYYPYSRAYYGPTTQYRQSYYPPAYRAVQPVQQASYQPINVNRPVYLNVQVPPDAQVWFGGRETSQTGASRRFVSPPLKAGSHYTYEITAKFMRDGKEVTEKRTVRFEAGKQSELSVDFNAPQS